MEKNYVIFTRPFMNMEKKIFYILLIIIVEVKVKT